MVYINLAYIVYIIVLYSAAVIGCMRVLSLAVSRSMASKTVSASEQGNDHNDTFVCLFFCFRAWQIISFCVYCLFRMNLYHAQVCIITQKMRSNKVLSC